MTYYKCKYAGNPRNEGRFGNVKEGDILMLTKEEYDCVAENDDFEFIEEYQESLPNSVSTNSEKQEQPAPAPEEVEHDEDDDDYSMTYADMKKSELVSEIEDRNEGRDEEDKISATGLKSDLIDRLEEDDDLSIS